MSTPLSGAGTGTLFLTGFGTAWLVTANLKANGLVVGYLALGLFAAIMAAESFRLDRLQTRSLIERSELDFRWNARLRNQFLFVNVLQYVGIGLATVACIIVDQPDRITGSAVAVIGSHFIPLARLFRVPLYYATGGVMMICGVFSAWNSSVLFGALAAGTTLWATSGWTLVAWRRRLARDSGRE